MKYDDVIDILVGLGILLLIAICLIIRERERKRVGQLMDDSVGEKYMQLMAAFMKIEGARLIDMSTNSADMKIIRDDSEEKLSIFQSEKGVNIQWSFSEGPTNLTREYSFNRNETQDEIIKVIEAGIIDAKQYF